MEIEKVKDIVLSQDWHNAFVQYINDIRKANVNPIKLFEYDKHLSAVLFCLPYFCTFLVTAVSFMLVITSRLFSYQR